MRSLPLRATGALSLAVLWFAFLPASTASTGPVYQLIDPAHNDRVSVMALSANGRYVAFDALDAKGGQSRQVFVFDRIKKTSELVSVSLTGGPSDLPSYSPAISADGRYVAFYSPADNLVDGDHNRANDVFVRDRQAHKTYRIDVTPAGGELESGEPGYGPSISADGATVAFVSNGTVFTDPARRPTGLTGAAPIGIYVTHWRTPRSIQLVTQTAAGHFIPNNASLTQADISGNGQYVAFAWDVNLAYNKPLTKDPGDTGTGFYVRDLQHGTTHLLLAASPSPHVQLDYDGQVAAIDLPDATFASLGTAEAVDWVHHVTTPLSDGTTGHAFDSALSANGRYVLFASYTQVWNLAGQSSISIWKHDLKTGAQSRVDVCATTDVDCVVTQEAGDYSPPQDTTLPALPFSLSADGAVTAFTTPASLTMDDPDRDLSAMASRWAASNAGQLSNAYVQS